MLEVLDGDPLFHTRNPKMSLHPTLVNGGEECSAPPSSSAAVDRYFYRTNRVVGSSTPIFNKSFVLRMPHYQSRIRISLMDAVSERAIGENQVSMFQLMQVSTAMFVSFLFAHDVVVSGTPIGRRWESLQSRPRNCRCIIPSPSLSRTITTAI